MYHEQKTYKEPSHEQDQEEFEEEQVRNRPDIMIIREMIYDKNIPRSLADKLWGVVSKSQVLSNVTDVDERIMLRMFMIIKREIYCSMCSADVTSDFKNNLANLEAVFRANLTRAKGENRERMLEAKQIMEQLQGGQRRGSPEFKRGFWSSIGGKLFGRKKYIPPVEEN